MRNYFKRRHERYHTYSPYIAESWNTFSNIAFVWGAAFLSDDAQFAGAVLVAHETRKLLVALMAMIGICSGIHHALCDRYDRYTLVLDWIPIVASMITLSSVDTAAVGFFGPTSMSTFIVCGVALAFLITDHVCHVLPPPIGHVIWHVTAALGMTMLYWDWFTFGLSC